MIDKRFILSVDFDGTIVEEAYPKIGKLRENAKQALDILYLEGFTIIINSCRTGKFEGEAYQFLQDNNIRFHYFNCNIPELISEFGMDCRKISADLYIDDKCLTGLPSWEKIYDLIHEKYTEKMARRFQY